MIITVVAIYLCLVIVVGIFGSRLFRQTGEDYFVASRSIGSFVLMMTLLGTNLTAFTMLGASGEAYRHGVVVFGLMGASSSIIIPFLFYYLGTRSWWLGKRFSYVTQIQLIRDRYGSPALGTLLFVAVVFLMLPYILIGVKGGGDAFAAITKGEWPGWVGSLFVCSVTFLYGRMFVVIFLALAFVASLFTSRSIFSLGAWSLTGFSGLVSVFVGALFWKRSTKQGAGSAIVSVILLWIIFYVSSLGVEGAYSVGGTGLIPVAVIVPVSTVVLVVVSLFTRPPADADRFFPSAPNDGS